jgi:hypothetical protein
LPLSAKWIDAERLSTFFGQFPICQQFFPMQVNPHLHHSQLPCRQVASEQCTVVNGDRGPVVLITNMNVCQVMLFLDFEKHQDDDSIEHADRGHGELSANLDEHCHSGIGHMTSHSVHYGQAQAMREVRQATLNAGV